MDDQCPDLKHLLTENYLSPVYALEFTLGFLANLVVVLGYPLCLQEWWSSNIYLYNLAVSDLICVCALPRLSYLYANHLVETSSVACVLNRYLLFVNMYSSVVFMALVSLDRYLLIRHPSRNHVLLTPRGAICICLVTWLYVNVLITPLLFYATHSLANTNGSICMDFASMSKTWGFLGYSLALTILGYILPMVALFLCTYKISSMLKKQEVAFENRKTSYGKPLRIVRAAAYMFLVLYLPYHIMRAVRILSGLVEGISDCVMVKIEAAYMVMRPFPYAHSVINPIFYFLITEHFRELLLARFQQLRRFVRSYVQSRRNEST